MFCSATSVFGQTPTFRPERFSTNGGQDAGKNSFIFVGGGVRRCVGEQLLDGGFYCGDARDKVELALTPDSYSDVPSDAAPDIE